MYYKSVCEAVGNTPLVEISSFAKNRGLHGKILCKLEFANPAGSVKDRVALALIEDAENRGLLTRGGTVIEATSGNTGIGLVAVCAAKGYKAVIVMPDSMSRERIDTLRAYGARVVLTDGREGMTGAVKKANELALGTPGSYMPCQFSNPANAQVHYRTTGREIWRACGGDVDIFVAGVGTGGTITGAGRYLRECKRDIRVVAVEPLSSPVLGGGKAGKHGIMGIGAGFVPDVLDTSVYDEVVAVSDSDAYAFARALAAEEGIFAGISSGAVLSAAVSVLARSENEGKTVAVILPDGGGKYLSTPLIVKT